MDYRDKFKELLDAKKIFSISDNYKERYPEYSTDIWCKRVDDFISVVENLIKN